MDEKKIKFLQEINNGNIKGGQRIIAQKLQIADSSVSLWFKGIKSPSLDSIIKMAKIFNKTENEIRNIFSMSADTNTNNYAGFAITSEIELLKEKMKNLELEISLLKKDNELLKKELEFIKK